MTGRKRGEQDKPLLPSKEVGPRVMDREEPQYPGKPELFILFFFFGIFLLKPLNSSCGIQEFLFSSKKRMAAGADFYMDLLFRTLRLECRSASALDHCVKNLRVYIFLHLMMASKLYFTDFSQNFNYLSKPGIVVGGGERYWSLLIHGIEEFSIILGGLHLL